MHRLFIQLSIISALSSANMSIGIAACSGSPMRTGWCWPTASGGWSSYLEWHGHNSGFSDPHLAQDIKAAENDPVYAVAKGLVLIVRENVSKYGGAGPCSSDGKTTSSIPGAGIIVRHYTSNGEPVDALYAHLKNVQVKRNDVVEPGDIIGYVRNYTWCGLRKDHLHFGVAFPGRNIAAYDNAGTGDVWAGYGDTDRGFMNPVSFFSDHSVGNTFSCNPTKERCSFRVRDAVGWFPPVDMCDNASQWYIVGKTTDGENYLMGSSDRSVCRQIPAACYPN